MRCRVRVDVELDDRAVEAAPRLVASPSPGEVSHPSETCCSEETTPGVVLLRCYGGPRAPGVDAGARTYTSGTVGEQVEPDTMELVRLREELRSCRLELAERHRELETLQEERHELLRRCEAAEEQVQRLSAPLHRQRTEGDQTPSGRLRRRKAST